MERPRGIIKDQLESNHFSSNFYLSATRSGRLLINPPENDGLCKQPSSSSQGASGHQLGESLATIFPALTFLHQSSCRFQSLILSSSSRLTRLFRKYICRFISQIPHRNGRIAATLQVRDQVRKWATMRAPRSPTYPRSSYCMSEAQITKWQVFSSGSRNARCMMREGRQET